MPALADRLPFAATSRLCPASDPPPHQGLPGLRGSRRGEIALRARADGTSDREDAAIEWARPALSFRRARAGHDGGRLDQPPAARRARHGPADQAPLAETSRLAPGVRSPTAPGAAWGIVEPVSARSQLGLGPTTHQEALAVGRGQTGTSGRRARAGHGVRAGLGGTAMEVASIRTPPSPLHAGPCRPSSLRRRHYGRPDPPAAVGRDKPAEHYANPPPSPWCGRDIVEHRVGGIALRARAVEWGPVRR
jgi:hypothetical protein